jgi:hypothetical protein
MPSKEKTARHDFDLLALVPVFLLARKVESW